MVLHEEGAVFSIRLTPTHFHTFAWRASKRIGSTYGLYMMPYIRCSLRSTSTFRYAYAGTLLSIVYVNQRRRTDLVRGLAHTPLHAFAPEVVTCE